jgi:SAM-dependent methyltransferase
MVVSGAKFLVRSQAARLTRLSMDLARRGMNSAALSLNLLRARDTFDAGSNTACTDFVLWLSKAKGARVLEIGTRRTEGGAPTTRRHWAHSSAEYVTSDFMAGLDVDVVADAEKLSDTFGKGSFDAVIGCSVFEHIKRPWLASAEIGKVLRPGGKVFVQTHFAFPVHAYPYDYWRFTREALESLFDPEAGFSSCTSYYEFPAAIVSRELYLSAFGHAFLNVCAVAIKGEAQSG